AGRRHPRGGRAVGAGDARGVGVTKAPGRPSRGRGGTMNTFTRDGISFHYPANWQVDAEDAEDGGWTVVVTSPETAFVLVSLRPDARDPADLADQTLDALEADYKELDAENRVE